MVISCLNKTIKWFVC